MFAPQICRGKRAVPLAVAGLMAGMVALAAPAFAGPAVPFTNLTLVNGWTGYGGTATPAVADIAGVITFRGAISTLSTNTNEVAFTLPPGLRPARYLNIPVDMCNATTGELDIAPTGVTEVISSGSPTAAQCFTSLDGASFALSTSSFTKLTLRPGWKNRANSGRSAAASVTGGIVRLAGEIMTAGTNPAAFTLPAQFRPVRTVYVPVNLCTGSIGRLTIKPTGVVTVQGPGPGQFWAVQCGTSLEGASYALSAKSFTALKPVNGWLNGPQGAAKAAARVIAGIVHLKGAVWTKGTNAEPFKLAKGFRPVHTVYVSVAMCGGNYGRLNISPSGVVDVEAENNDFANAQCLTSLDGVTFAR